MQGAPTIGAGRRVLPPSAILLAGLVAALAGCLTLPAAAVAYPLYDGAMTFKAITGPDDPEEFFWEVQLEANQELKQIDEQHAAVYYDDGIHVAFQISATKAHDAVGASVPTSISVVGENVIVFTVHHRAGNPVAGELPFHYPVVAGEGWEGGYQTQLIAMPPDEEELRTERERREAEERERREASEGCRVPRLRSGSLRAAGRRLRSAGCKLGKVRGDRKQGAKVTKQDVRAGTLLPAGSSISVKLG